MTSRRTILLLASAVLLLAGCIPKARPRADDCRLIGDGFGPAGSVRVRAEVVADGLVVPWGIGFLPGGDLLVTERPGRVRLIRDGKLVATPVAVVDVTDGSESGLLGIAVDPRFAANRFFYLYATVYVPSFTVNRVMRYRLSEDGLSAERDAILIDGIQSSVFHDGGRLRFGPDGMLYVGTGDARRPKSAQKIGRLTGKILRIAPDGSGVPRDNPWPGKAAFVRGVRNTQGFDWLPDGRMIVTDHGPSGLEYGLEGHDEVSLARAGDNLGWPRIYGCGAKGGMVSPSLVWKDAVPPGGAAIYTGDAIPEWRGSLLIGTLRSKHLQRVIVDPQTGAVTGNEVYFQRTFGRLRDVAMGPDGHVYVTTSNCDGRGSCPPEKDKVLRIVPE